MGITDYLDAGDVAAALAQCKAADSFSFKQFCATSGLAKKSSDTVNKIFNIIDEDGSGYIEAKELKFFLQNFSSDARELGDSEIKTVLSAMGMSDDGKMNATEFQKLVSA
ncbi:parvalbumin, thymic [Callorhinchus milii]|uniref:Parvalbumin n=1 Tax=Callorhinchus milii TaxID=7868 RepID=V9LFS3_CALMI|nr:parvalbumin, thymic [Callorhinchus milii]XP_007907987.1 parvalbumin, thymic [Callorhinchus milii]XP_007907988.1 parvalbumin, thymic [Callorhinchus milii]XP_007907989.1 parvalbumin, thymic [Callorhinchus milii]XP_007907990.1 parvalbumin, thymic [Callorhinchus milii]XP_007907991.1 parvalbumin, thymic [Callorhinchus milii]|eukprot:gi/632982161/ref/XP_007907985.1/ PREDICTED: parvalbumin, thymic-like [Callorhinchus milii]